jgi:PAS domain-containing protein
MDGQERRETDGELARLRALVAHAPTLFAVMEGPEHVFRLANPAYLRTIGRREEDIAGQPFRAIFPEVKGQGLDAILDRVYADGEPYVGTEQPVWFMREDEGLGDAFFTFVFQPLCDAAGAVEGCGGPGAPPSTRPRSRTRGRSHTAPAGRRRAAGGHRRRRRGRMGGSC